MFTAKAFAANNPTSPLAAASIPRRDAGPDDVELEILLLRRVPLRPAHRTQRVGGVAHDLPVRARPRDRRAGHARSAPTSPASSPATSRRSAAWSIRAGRAGAARKGSSSTATRSATVFTYNSPDPHGTAPATYGGYSDRIVVNEHFVLRVSPKLDPAAAAPLLCAGITLYSPLQALGRGPRQEGRHRRPRRARAHGREVRARVRRAHGAVHDVAVEDRGRQAPRRRRGRHLEERRRDEEARCAAST